MPLTYQSQWALKNQKTSIDNTIIISANQCQECESSDCYIVHSVYLPHRQQPIQKVISILMVAFPLLIRNSGKTKIKRWQN